MSNKPAKPKETMFCENCAHYVSAHEYDPSTGGVKCRGRRGFECSCTSLSTNRPKGAQSE